MISGKLNKGQKMSDAEKYIDDEIQNVKAGVRDEEVEKVINQAASSTYFSETELLNKAITLSVAHSLGDANLVEQEIEWIRGTTKSQILDSLNRIVVDDNCSVLHYLSK